MEFTTVMNMTLGVQSCQGILKLTLEIRVEIDKFQ